MAKSEKFQRVDVEDELRADADGMPVFRRCFEHETLMSFTDDAGNYAFRDWWEEEGSAIFKKWCKGRPEHNGVWEWDDD